MLADKRMLYSHRCEDSGLNAVLNIESHNDGTVYEIESMEPRNAEELPAVHCRIHFQCGTISQAGVNGVSNESLLAILEDRLKHMQAGPLSCRENSIALTHVQDALHWLHHRTRDRVQRGVEGTLNK